jgi:hypothetical protein
MRHPLQALPLASRIAPARLVRAVLLTALLTPPTALCRAQSTVAADIPIPAKVYRYAERLVNRSDRDSDQRLDRQEWGRRWGFVTSDADLDGRVSLEELVGRIARYGQHRRIRLMPPPVEGEAAVTSLLNLGKGAETTAVASDAPQSDSTPDQPQDVDAVQGPDRPRDTKFVANPQRQSQGLPSWFPARDVNGDGQLSMAEFAPKPTSTTLAEFARYDRNGDGVITPDEYLRAAKSSTDNQQR